MKFRSPKMIWRPLILACCIVSGAEIYGLELGYGGRLATSTGAPLDGTVNLTFRFFSVETGGGQLGEVSVANVALVDGMFSVSLSLSNSQVQEIFQGGNTPIYIETVLGDQVYPRQKFTYVPYALKVPIDEDKLRYVDGMLTLSPGALATASGVTSVNLSPPPAGLTVSGGPITSSGSMSINLANDLAAVESLSTTGVVERTGTDSWGTFPVTQVGKDFLTAPDAAMQRSKLGLGSIATESSLSTSSVTEGTNLYFTTARARESFGAAPPLIYSTASGIFTMGQASSSGSGYLSSADFLAFANKQSAITPTSGLETSFLSTSSQAGLELKPDSADNIKTGELRFDELASHGTNYVGFKAPSVIDSNQIWTLPADDGSAGQVLTTNGAGILSWGTVSGGGGGGTVTSVNLTAPVAGITVNGGPVINSGTINLSLANDLAAVEGLTGTGGVERTGADSWATYPLTSAGKELLDDADPAAQRTTLGLGGLAVLSAVSGGIDGTISDGSITDHDISGTAGIAQSKISGLTTDLAGKEPILAAGASSQYFRGDKTWQTLNTSAVTEGSNLYFTNIRARQALSGSTPLQYDSATGVMSIGQASLTDSGVLSAADFVTFNAKQAAITSSSILNTGTVTSAMQNGLELKPYGSTPGNTGEIRFDELATNGSNYVGFKSPDTIDSNVTWTLPSSDGTGGYVLSTDGSGTLSWIAPTIGSVTNIATGTGLTGGTITSSGTISLANVGTSGTYTKVTTNAQGQVTAGASLTATDIPVLDASKITSGTLSVALGGTGATSFTNNGVLVGSGSSLLSATVAGTQYQVLRAEAGGVPTFGAINLDQAAAVTGALGLVNGGTGATTVAAARSNLGLGTAATLNVGTSASNLIQLDGNGKLPAVDGTQVTGVVKSAGDTMTGSLNLPSNGLVVGTNQLVLSGGNVGIGTTSPSALLQVDGSVNVNKDDNVLVVDASNAARLGFVKKLGFNPVIASGAGHPIIFSQSSVANLHTTAVSSQTMTERMRIAADGNVGIGTATPTSKLQLSSGEIGVGQQNNATAYMRLGMDSSYNQYLANNAYWTGTAYNYVNTAGYGGTASMIQQISGQLSILTASGGTNPISWSNRFTVLNNGNVGIGTTNPTSILDVNGSLRAGNIVRTGDTFTLQMPNLGAGAWYKLGTWTSTAQGSRAEMVIHAAFGFNTPNLSTSQGITHVQMSMGNQLTSGPNISGYYWVEGGNPPVSAIKAQKNDSCANGLTCASWDIYASVNAFNGPDNFVEIKVGPNSTWTNLMTVSSDPGSASSTVAAFPNTLTIPTGNVGIGTTSPAQKLHVSGRGLFHNAMGTTNIHTAMYNGQVNITNGLGSTGGRMLSIGLMDNGIATIQSHEPNVGYNPLFLNAAGGNVGINTDLTPSYTLQVNGSVAGVGGYINMSDERYKKEIQPLLASLARILAIRGVSYKWKDTEKYGDERQLGVIAQEIEKIVPEVVSTGKDGIKRVKYTDLIPLIIEAMKEWNRSYVTEIAAIKAENQEIKAKLNILLKIICEKDHNPELCK